MSKILYIDNPASDQREDLAQAMRSRLRAEVSLVGSIEDFAQQVAREAYDLYICGDSMLFRNHVVQGWEPLRKFLFQQKKEDPTKLVVLSNRPGVIEDAKLYQVNAFHKRNEFDKFIDYVKMHLGE